MSELANVHPGEVLAEEFLGPINEIVHGKRAVTADTALRLVRYFGTSESSWMGLQADYQLEEARARIEGDLDKVRPHAV